MLPGMEQFFLYLRKPFTVEIIWNILFSATFTANSISFNFMGRGSISTIVCFSFECFEPLQDNDPPKCLWVAIVRFVQINHFITLTLVDILPLGFKVVLKESKVGLLLGCWSQHFFISLSSNWNSSHSSGRESSMLGRNKGSFPAFTWFTISKMQINLLWEQGIQGVWISELHRKMFYYYYYYYYTP